MCAGTFAGFLRIVYYFHVLADIEMASEILVKHSNMQKCRKNMLSGCGFVA
jgi:hypothetical protein